MNIGCLMLCKALLAMSAVPTGPLSVKTETTLVSEAPMNYCGLFCVYAAAEERGIDVEFGSLVDRSLLTGRFGSSIGNVIEALDRCGIDGHPKAGMTLEQLSSLTEPALLHVAVPTVGNSYRHWVLYLGQDADGNIRIYDPPRSTGTLSAAELLSVWDGVAVLTEPPALETYAPDVRFIGMALMIVVGAGFLSKRMSSGKLVVCTVALTATVAGVLPGTGIFNAPLAVGSVQARFFHNEFPELDYPALKDQMTKPHVLIDARTKRAFAYSHIPGAINVPVNSGFVTFCQAAQKLENDVPVILYCQSEGCVWGDEVANQLQGRGVENIRIYRGGMNEWSSRHR